MDGKNFKDDNDVWGVLRHAGIDLSTTERENLNTVFVSTELREMPGEPPMRRSVQVPLARLPGLNSVLLKVVHAVLELRDVSRELVPDPRYVQELEEEIHLLNEQIEVYRNRDKAWEEMSVFAKLLASFTRKTTRRRSGLKRLKSPGIRRTHH